MKIEVNIQAPELVSALNNLANAMGSAPEIAPVSKSGEGKKKTTAKKTDKSKTDDKSAKSKKDDKPKAEGPEQEKTEVEIPSVEDVRAKTAEAAKAGKKAEIKALLDDFGVNAVSQIPEDKRADYLEKLADL